jgi:hypothetical protein
MTKCTKVPIAGKQVQLPPAAGLDGDVVVSYGQAILPDGRTVPMNALGTPQPDAPWPETNFIGVRRGDVRAWVGAGSGKIAGTEPPGREADFAWLAVALR